MTREYQHAASQSQGRKVFPATVANLLSLQLHLPASDGSTCRFQGQIQLGICLAGWWWECCTYPYIILYSVKANKSKTQEQTSKTLVVDLTVTYPHAMPLQTCELNIPAPTYFRGRVAANYIF